MRDNDTQSLLCHWYIEADGSRWLIPGCISRANDLDAECTCRTQAAELADLHDQLDRARARHKGMRQWTDALNAAINSHSDAAALMRAAHEALRVRRKTSTNADL